MKKWQLTRREMLKGMFAGSACFVGLPLLEAMYKGKYSLFAAEATASTRPFFLFYTFGNGVGNYSWNGGTNHWTPSGSGSSWSLSPNMAPLAAHKDYISPLSNMRPFISGGTGHHQCRAAVFSGQFKHDIGGDAYQGLGSDLPSLDQYIGDLLQAQGDQSIYHSLVLALSRVSYNYGTLGTGHSLSWKKGFKVQVPEFHPRALYNRLFSGFTPPQQGSGPSPEGLVEINALDAVLPSYQRLKAKLGRADTLRVDQHLESLFETQKAIKNYEQATCQLPSMPNSDFPPNSNNVEPLVEKNIAMAKLIAQALSCGLTRSINYMFCGMQGNPVISDAGATDGFHKITHDGVADDGANRSGIPSRILIDRITEFNMARFADLLTELRNTPSGTGNLLDQGCILMASDFMVGARHNQDTGTPLIMAGKAGGKLKTNYHYVAPNNDNARNTSHALITALQAMGFNQNTIDGGENESCTGAISDIMNV